MKKLLSLILTVSLLLSVSTSSLATELTNQPLLSQMSEEECIEFVVSRGIKIPRELEDYEDLGLFIKSTITKIEHNPSHIFSYNYYAFRDLANDIKNIVNAYYTTNNNSLAVPAAEVISSLQYSTVIGTWQESYLNYNCYAYAVGDTGFSRTNFFPGCYSFPEMFSITSSVVFWASLTVSDLHMLGYECVITKTSYFDIDDYADTYNLICLRRGETDGAIDFHYMKLVGTRWNHKPGRTNLLKYNYLPYGGTWSNEASFKGVCYAADMYYTGTIQYFAFANNHNYEAIYANDHYHSGNRHYYYMHYVCDCGDEYHEWTSFSCSGPPCMLEYASIPNRPILTTK